MAGLTRTLQSRLATVNDLDAVKGLTAELGAAQWEGSPDAADAERLPFILARVRSDRLNPASLPAHWTVFGRPWREVLEMPVTKQELLARDRPRGARVVAGAGGRRTAADASRRGLAIVGRHGQSGRHHPP
ncbi:MAG TPA: hypothetical protein VFS20_00180 [Longimicrobium sp.]|nr:hypothetical protein [Longimicrobium sp.]